MPSSVPAHGVSVAPSVKPTLVSSPERRPLGASSDAAVRPPIEALSCLICDVVAPRAASEPTWTALRPIGAGTARTRSAAMYWTWMPAPIDSQSVSLTPMVGVAFSVKMREERP